MATDLKDIPIVELYDELTRRGVTLAMLQEYFGEDDRFDEDDDREPDGGMEDQFLDGQWEDRFELHEF